MKNGPWISAHVQAHIEPPSIPLIKMGLEEERETYNIKVKMWRNPTFGNVRDIKYKYINVR